METIKDWSDRELKPQRPDGTGAQEPSTNSEEFADRIPGIKLKRLRGETFLRRLHM